MKRYAVIPLALLLVAAMGLTLAGCGKAGAPVAPTVTLNGIFVDKYEALHKDWPTGYDPSRVGFFELAMVFDVTNPNDYPIKLEEARASVDFAVAPDKWVVVNAAAANEYQWIPAKTTNQVRLNVLFTTRAVSLALNLPGAVTLKELGLKTNDVIKQWWTDVPDFKFKIRVSGAMNFTSPNGSVTSTFSEVYPK
ncbi:MAG: hypothetical protein FJ013_07470 [Chloroflexi bacterium]|nr:hypothetical protein [Chloroflexota bacterium]